MIFHIFICILYLLRVYFKLKNSHLPDGLIAQSVEHYSGIAGERSWVQIPYRPDFLFFKAFLHNRLIVHVTAMINHKLIDSLFIAFFSNLYNMITN